MAHYRLTEGLCRIGPLSAVFLLTCITGCHSGPSVSEQYAARKSRPATTSGTTILSVHGEWLFVYTGTQLWISSGDYSPPPSFDIIEFRTDGTVHLVNSMWEENFTGTYELIGNRIRWTFTPPNATEPVEHELVYTWSERGRTLTLRPAQAEHGEPTDIEWTYYRPGRLAPADEIVGRWSSTVENEEVHMTFEPDGRFLMDDGTYSGYYRLWLSRHGPTLTTPVWIPGAGGFIINQLYAIDADELVLTPIGQDGPIKDETMFWKRTAH